MQNKMTKAASMASTGQFCTVTFVTKAGAIRTMNGRTDVVKYLKGGRLTGGNKYMTLWVRDGSIKFDAARKVAVDRILELRAHGVVVKMNEASKFAKTV